MGDVKLHGLDTLTKTLKDLPLKLGERVVRGGLRAAAKPIKDDAQANAPVLKKADPRRKAGKVKESITVRKSKQDRYGVYVGVKPLKGKQITAFKKANKGKSSADNPDDPFYWKFSEFGAAHHAATPFLRPAFENRKHEALTEFEDYAKKRIVKESEKIARENGFSK